MTGSLVSLNIGACAERVIDGRRFVTAFGKRPVTGPRRVHGLGIDGDEQADPSVHGGLSRAVYAYPIEHYEFWRTVRAQALVAGWGDPLDPGALGENLTLAGMLESQAWIGDVLRFPDCALAVSEPRTPCFKLDAALGFRHASKLMASSGWCGFYLSVRIPGTIAAGEAFELIPGPREVGIGELFRARMSRRAQAA